MDLQFIQFNDVLPLAGVREVPNFSPRTLQIRGANCKTAIEVVINGVSTASFVVVDDNTILAEVPVSQVHTAIEDVSVISSDYTASTRSLLTFEIGNNPKKVKRTKVLVQTYVKLLLTTPGYDSFSQMVGGAVQDLVGSNVGKKGTSATSMLAVGVAQAAEQMRALQAQQARLDDNERLLAANLINLSFDPTTSSLAARVELLAQSGMRATANLEI